MPVLTTPSGPVVFIHIPKTGGQSILQAFGLLGLDIEDSSSHAILYGWDKYRMMEFTHMTYQGVRTMRPDLMEYPSMAIVRNPYDRAVSSYLFWKRIGNCRAVGRTILDMGFEEWITTTKDVCNEALLQFDYCHFIPQSRFTHGVQTVLRYEQYADSVKQYFAGLGVTVEIPHVNASGHEGKYSEMHTARTREIIQKTYSEDFKNFGYEM